LMIATVVMVGGGHGGSGAGAWVQGARRAATLDLLKQLARQPLCGPIILVTPEAGELAAGPVDHVVSSRPGAIHVGQELARMVSKFNVSRLLYFGGGSAPLLSDAVLATTLQQLAEDDRIVLTNNQFASDWLGVSPASVLSDWIPRLPRDNMMGWVLSEEAGLPIRAQAPSAESRLDIDTPIDLLALRLHPATKPQLGRYLERLELPMTRLDAALDVLAAPASHVFIGGRLDPEVWLTLNRVTRCWLRVISEERGMVSSGRQSRGEVHSLLAAHVEAVGVENFFSTLAGWADAAFIDTRVLLAHYNCWPDSASRFASDLGQAKQVADEWLRTFTQAALEAPIPVILGGHGLMSGAMLAFSDVLASRLEDAQARSD
jgi:hypothetical protein